MALTLKRPLPHGGSTLRSRCLTSRLFLKIVPSNTLAAARGTQKKMKKPAGRLLFFNTTIAKRPWPDYRVEFYAP
jgi:hypothetical protein